MASDFAALLNTAPDNLPQIAFPLIGKSTQICVNINDAMFSGLSGGSAESSEGSKPPEM